jgi:hypothetical protein
MIKAPWSDEVVERLKAWQADDRFHPFTCPGDKPGCKRHRELIPTNEGWVCACGEYRQDWAHDFMGAN